MSLQSLIIHGSNDGYFTPDIHFDASTGECSISGESYLEDSFEFYDRLIAWVEKYFESGKQSITFNIKLTYFNTSSSRAILDLLRKLKETKEAGKDVTINWYYPDPDDDEMKLEAEDFVEESGMPMNLVQYELED